MELREVLRRRRMVRRYRAEAVDPSALGRVVDAFHRAPSAGHAQGQHLVVVTDPKVRSVLARLCREPEHLARGFPPWLSGAPVHLVPCTRPADYQRRYDEPDKAASRGPARWDVPFHWVDGGAALMLLLLAAVDEGLGAGLLDIPDPDGVRALLDIPADVHPIGLVTLGHPADDERTVRSRPRRPLQEVVHHQRWSE